MFTFSSAVCLLFYQLFVYFLSAVCLLYKYILEDTYSVCKLMRPLKTFSSMFVKLLWSRMRSWSITRSIKGFGALPKDLITFQERSLKIHKVTTCCIQIQRTLDTVFENHTKSLTLQLSVDVFASKLNHLKKCRKLAKIVHFDFWRENSNIVAMKIKVARFARIFVKWDILGDFQTP